jgi:hypothetical protein
MRDEKNLKLTDRSTLDLPRHCRDRQLLASHSLSFPCSPLSGPPKPDITLNGKSTNHTESNCNTTLHIGNHMPLLTPANLIRGAPIGHFVALRTQDRTVKLLHTHNDGISHGTGKPQNVFRRENNPFVDPTQRPAGWLPDTAQQPVWSNGLLI